MSSLKTDNNNNHSNNNIETTENDIIKDHDEVGYFFLKDTVATIIHKRRKRKSTLQSTKQTNDSFPKKCNYSRKKWISDQWTDIHIKDDCHHDVKGEENTNEKNPSIRSIRKHTTSTKSSICNLPILCPRCNFVLQVHDDDDDDDDDNMMLGSSIEYNISKKCFFNGLVHDLRTCDECNSYYINDVTDKTKTFESSHHEDNNSRRTNPTNPTNPTNRTDASILLGTILQCKDKGFVRIESFQILMSGTIVNSNDIENVNNDNSNTSNSDEKCDNSILYENQTIHQVKCSIVITISLPVLEKVSQSICSLEGNSEHKATINNKLYYGHYDEYLSTNSHGFPPFGQLFFSIMRSDWSYLDEAKKCLMIINQDLIRRFDNNNNNNNNDNDDDDNMISFSNENQNEITSMFPTNISLEELYVRIRGASTHQDIASSFDNTFEKREQKSFSKSQSMEGSILGIPSDVLQLNIAPFLRARSLNNLRLSCRYFYYILRAVVPGMKLTLYPHQVRSLQWMRRRESSYLTEDDSINYGTDNECVDKVLNGDFYRSVTAGSIISVTPKPKPSAKACTRRNPLFWHINTWSGACSLQYRSERLRTVARCRNVARGGLLCDDPGLGKTITILSLILQTSGQCTEYFHERKGRKAVSDDLIIDSYWREILVTSTRQQELIVLCLKLRKYDINQYFQQPIHQLLSPEAYGHYKTVINDPLCLDYILAKIRNNFYDESVYDFKNDIETIYNNALKYYPPENNIHKKAIEILKAFGNMFDDFLNQKMLAAMSVAQKRSKESLSALVAESKRIQLLDNLICSKGTLLVVPSTLVKHWEVRSR